jgi:hypothetical protein
MKIRDIREVIEGARWLRRDLEKVTPTAQNLERLSAKIVEMKALEIPARFLAERMQRDAEIGACEDFIRRWLKERGQTGVIEIVDVRPEVFKGSERSIVWEPEPTERLYGRGGVVLRVIDGGKKV